MVSGTKAAHSYLCKPLLHSHPQISCIVHWLSTLHPSGSLSPQALPLAAVASLLPTSWNPAVPSLKTSVKHRWWSDVVYTSFFYHFFNSVRWDTECFTHVYRQDFFVSFCWFCVVARVTLSKVQSKINTSRKFQQIYGFYWAQGLHCTYICTTIVSVSEIIATPDYILLHFW